MGRDWLLLALGAVLALPGWLLMPHESGHAVLGASIAFIASSFIMDPYFSREARAERLRRKLRRLDD